MTTKKAATKVQISSRVSPATAKAIAKAAKSAKQTKSAFIAEIITAELARRK
jgi:uncharacterized protein (DUF1778 family)